MKRADLIGALQIFDRIDKDKWIGGADHDIIFLSSVDQDNVSDDDKAKLEEFGVHWDTEYSCWAAFT